MSDARDVSRRHPKTETPVAAASLAPPVFDELPAVAPINLSPVIQAVLRVGSGIGEELRILRSKVKGLDEEGRFRCFGLVSAAPEEGKSTLALGLAAALAQEPHRRILLVDGDVRKPALEPYLGLPRVPGLSEWLQGTRATITLRRVNPPGFFLLSSGLAGEPPPELIGSERMVRLIAAARSAFDFVVFDCAPLVSVADSVIMQDLLDGYLLVVRARHTPRETILKALSNLKPDRIRGTVFNDHRDVIPGYSTYGYRSYGPYR